MAFSITGTYVASKAAWWSIIDEGQSVDNYSRWVIAHSTVLGDLANAGSYQPISYNFAITSVNGESGSSITVVNDDSQRTAAHDAGVSNNPDDGSDFLYLGNYVHGTATSIKIDDTTVPGGKIYFAGQSEESGGYNGTIIRGWVEVLSTSDLEALIPLVDGNSYTITGSDLLVGE